MNLNGLIGVHEFDLRTKQVFKIPVENIIPESYERLMHDEARRFIIELNFVEAKGIKDSIRFEQFMWAYSTNVPFKFVFCISEEK